MICILSDARELVFEIELDCKMIKVKIKSDWLLDFSFLSGFFFCFLNRIIINVYSTCY